MEHRSVVITVAAPVVTPVVAPLAIPAVSSVAPAAAILLRDVTALPIPAAASNLLLVGPVAAETLGTRPAAVAIALNLHWPTIAVRLLLEFALRCDVWAAVKVSTTSIARLTLLDSDLLLIANKLRSLLLVVVTAAIEPWPARLLLHLGLLRLRLLRPLLALLMTLATTALLLIVMPTAIAVVLSKRGRSCYAGQENSYQKITHIRDPSQFPETGCAPLSMSNR